MKGRIKQPAKGSWTLWLELGRDENGEHHQKTVTVRGTKREAERELTRLLHKLNTGAFVEPAKMTLAQYLERSLADDVKVHNSAKTHEGYEEFIRKHLAPSLDQPRLSQFQPMHIQQYYSPS